MLEIHGQKKNPCDIFINIIVKNIPTPTTYECHLPKALQIGYNLSNL